MLDTRMRALLGPALEAAGRRLAAGTETIAVYLLLFLLPPHVTVIVWAFTAAVAITAAQRVVLGLRLLRAPASAEPAGRPAAAAGGGHRHPGAAPVTHQEPAA